jgi:hypothetical protein
MKRFTPRRMLPAALLAAGITLGCHDTGGPDASAARDAQSPADNVGQLADVGAEGSGSVAMPLTVDATILWVVDPQNAPANCDGTPGLAEGSGWGEGTHLGRFEIATFDHCSIDVAAFVAEVAGLEPDDPAFQQALVEHIGRDGEFTWTAADGSTLGGTYEMFLPNAGPGSTEFGPGAVFALTITDGTGRLAGATGQLEADLSRSTYPSSPDPLYLELTTFPVALEGEITVPRP